MCRIYLIILFTWLCIPSGWATDTLRIAGPNDLQIAKHLYEYKDCTGRASVEEVIRQWQQGAFRKLAPARVVNRGITSCTHWFAITLQNTSAKPENYLWSCYNDGIQFTFYELNRTGKTYTRREQLSNRTPLDERPVPIRSISFALPMEPGETKQYLLKTELKGRPNLYFPTDISTESDILLYELRFSLLLGHYYGFFFFAIVFNLCLYIVLRNRFYAMMLGYICSLLAFNLIEYLHDAYLIPDAGYAWWVRIPKPVFLGLALYFNIHVFMSFVRQRKYFPKFSRILNIMSKVVLTASLTILGLHALFSFPPQLANRCQQLFVATLLLTTSCLLTNIIASAWRRTPYIWHYIVGNSLLFLSVTLYILNAMHVLYLPQITTPGNIIFAFCAECIYLMIVFTVKYRKDLAEFVANIREEEEKRKKLTLELLSVQENERLRISQEIHDGIGGSLQGLRLLLSLENLQAEKKIRGMLTSINEDFRRLIHQLSPRHLERMGLFEAIRLDAAAHVPRPRIAVDCTGDDTKLSQDMKINVFRIYQELLTNALKHALGAGIITVDLTVDELELRLIVEDDGRAEPAASAPQQPGMGMQNIRSRVDYYGGHWSAEFGEYGSTVLIILPLTNKINPLA